MALIKPFAAVRPIPEMADRMAALPYDVYTRAEACEEVKREPMSFLAIDRAETGFDSSVDTYAPCVYERAKALLCERMEKGFYITEDKPVYYIYELIMDGRSQTGIVACASIDDYIGGVIKKHEETRAEKEADRINHVDITNAQTGPIFLAYRAKEKIDETVAEAKKGEPLYAFVSPDGISHNVWVVDKESDIETLCREFKSMNEIYIADGHHRAASAVKVGIKRRNENPGYSGDEEFNFFLSVLFPDNQLKILPYNRVVRDLNGMTDEEFLEKLGECFDIKAEDKPYQPEVKGSMGLYLSGKWYRLDAHPELKSDDPVKGLDVSVLQDNVLSKLLGIDDPKTDKRIDFVGGIRGLSELERRTEADMKAAFSMYPTDISELFGVADAGLLMPPKSTWFEPKLRSGIFIHELG